MDQSVLDAAQAKEHSVKSNCIRAARCVIERELGIRAALTQVHFLVHPTVRKDAVGLDYETDGWSWTLIPQEQAPPTPRRLGGRAPAGGGNSVGATPSGAAKPERTVARGAVAVPAKAVESAPPPDRRHPPTRGALPRPTGDPVKDGHMPPWGRAGAPVNLEPKKKIYPPKAGSKYGVLCVLLNRRRGMTLGEAYDAITAGGWKHVVIRPALVHKINRIAGYGIRQEDFNGVQHAFAGRRYEAERLGMAYTDGPNEGEITTTPGPNYDEKATLPVFFLVVPAGAKVPE